MTMKKKLLLFILILSVLLVAVACSEKYDKGQIIGKTSAHIEEIYGEFDIVMADADADGVYRNTKCGYLTKESRVGFLGTPPDEFLMISFDSDGVAFEIEEDFPRPGG